MLRSTLPSATPLWGPLVEHGRFPKTHPVRTRRQPPDQHLRLWPVPFSQRTATTAFCPGTSNCDPRRGVIHPQQRPPLVSTAKGTGDALIHHLQRPPLVSTAKGTGYALIRHLPGQQPRVALGMDSTDGNCVCPFSGLSVRYGRSHWNHRCVRHRRSKRHRRCTRHSRRMRHRPLRHGCTAFPLGGCAWPCRLCAVLPPVATTPPLHSHGDALPQRGDTRPPVATTPPLPTQYPRCLGAAPTPPPRAALALTKGGTRMAVRRHQR